MLGQAVVSVLLIAGCLLYEAGTRERTIKHSQTLR